MKIILEALKFCKENDLFGKHINFALGEKKLAQTFEEGILQNKIRKFYDEADNV